MVLDSDGNWKGEGNVVGSRNLNDVRWEMKNEDSLRARQKKVLPRALEMSRLETSKASSTKLSSFLLDFQMQLRARR